MCDNDFTTLSIIMMILSRYNNYHDSTTNGKNTELPFLMPTILKSNSKFIAQLYTYTRTLMAILFISNFMVILSFSCYMSCFIYHDNHQLYHITIMDLCDTIITLSILLHITSSYKLSYCMLVKVTVFTDCIYGYLYEFGYFESCITTAMEDTYARTGMDMSLKVSTYQ